MKPLVFLLSVLSAGVVSGQRTSPGWQHLSARHGDFPPPNSGTQQTSATVFDIDRDGVNDFAIAERTAAPAVVWYRRGKNGWTRYVLEPAALHIEAGSTSGDVDGDGDLDFIAAGDYKSNEVWWWENPYPNYDPSKGWTRRTIKASGEPKHHDMMFGDFDGDGRNDLVFWNQGDNRLILARMPADPKQAREWPMIDVYRYRGDSQPEQRAEAPPFKSVNEHEGLVTADIDGDGRADIVGGGLWFKHLGGDRVRLLALRSGTAQHGRAAGSCARGGRRRRSDDPVRVAERDLDAAAADRPRRQRPQPQPGGLQRRRPPRHLLRGNAA
jgi:hypothetical protein